MMPSETGRRRVGRPRVCAKPEDVNELRCQGASWREIGKALQIGTATAMRLSKLCDSTGPDIQQTSPKTIKVDRTDCSIEITPEDDNAFNN
jgi:hypothetical protein